MIFQSQIISITPSSSWANLLLYVLQLLKYVGLISIILLFLVLMVQLGEVFLWTYVYAIMRLSANKATKEIDTNDSTIQDITSEETPYSEICTEALLPSRGCPTSEEYTDQVEVPFSGCEGKAKVSSDILLLRLPIYNVQKLAFFKIWFPLMINSINEK